MTVRFEISDEIRRLMARYHRVTQALIQDRANEMTGRDNGSWLGIVSHHGGVQVGRREITILRDTVTDGSVGSTAETAEELAVARVIHDLATQIQEGGEAVLAGVDLSYFWFEMFAPLHAMLGVPERSVPEDEKVIFLDIDGVLLRPIDWLHPRNAEAWRLWQSKDHRDRRRALDLVQFDPEAVGLVNRLARKAGAKVVVSSFWRSAVGANQSLRKLITQGIERDLFHEHAYCPHFPSDKRKDIDIRDWLRRHRADTTVDPDSGQIQVHWTDWIVLDDEPGGQGWVLTHTDDGFTASTYRVALRALGGEDPEFGVHPIPADLWKEVLAVHSQDWVAAARWLEGG